MSDASPPLLAVRDVHKAYPLGRRRIEVLRGIDWAVAAGSFVALRGASGAGSCERLQGRGILLVDVVFTTGTTVSECCRVLRAAGAGRIEVFTLARSL